MKKFRRNIRGQFVVVAALLIALLTLSLAVSIHQINLHRQELRYKPVQELVLGITSDLERALSHALNISSRGYYFSNRSDTAAQAARTEGEQFISKWVRSVLTSYSNLALNITTTIRNESFSFDSWNTLMGRSSVDVDFDLDVNAYGFKGWVGHSAKYVTLRIFPESINLTGPEKTLNFHIEQSALYEDEGVPIPNLTNVTIETIVTGNFPISADVIDLIYLGGGNYTLTFKPRISGRTIGVILTAITPEDGIYVQASYRYNDIIVTLQSQEDTLATTNLGSIQLGEIIFDVLPNATSIDPSTYLLAYTPENASYTFLNWTTTGYITVNNSYVRITRVTINGNGTITAFYRGYTPPETTIVTLTLDSRDWENLTQHLGNITLSSTTYTLPNATDLTVGDYALEYEPHDSSYVFLWWEPIGNIFLANSSANPTKLKILGNGTIIAVYRYELPPPPLVTVNLESLEDSNASQNLGRIKLGEIIFELPNSTTVSSSTYWLEYFPENERYTFLNWTTIGSITVTNSSSSWTAATINGDGTIIAFYSHYTQPEPEMLKLIMDSREEGNETLTHLGNIIFNSTPYTLPNATSLTAGEYTLEYEPDNSSSYFFIRWEWDGNIIPLEPDKNSTILRVFGNGTIIAVYGAGPPITTLYNVTLQSQEENSPIPTNNGTIKLGVNLFSLPNSTSVLNGTYWLEYIPAEGYTFISWITTEGISVEDPLSRVTLVTINADGNITAFYGGCNIFLDSRHRENLSFSIGNITLGSETYTLPNHVKGLAAGDYTIQYTPPNSSYVFLWWEVTGGLFPTNSSNSVTTLKIFGDGNLTAVYYVEPPIPTQATVILQSLEETLAPPGNLGKIRLGETLFGLPNSTTVTTGTYLLEYTPAEGYTFARWATTGNISVGITNSPITNVIINGDGNITAIYRGCKIFLDSIAWDNSSQHLGTITLGSISYKLPNFVTGLSNGDYSLQYSPHNESYVFLWWESSGDVIIWNGTSANTTLTVYSDGTVTAVYGLISESPPPPPFVGEWNVLYVDARYKLVPPFMWSGKNGHLPSHASTGKDKQESILTSPPTPTLYLAELVNITVYIRPVPPNSAKDVYLELGFNYSGQYYKLGDGTFPANSQGMYRLTVDISHGEFPGEIGVVPEGSVFILKTIVTFYVPPNGFFFLYYGPSDPSRIELF